MAVVEVCLDFLRLILLAFGGCEISNHSHFRNKILVSTREEKVILVVDCLGRSGWLGSS